MSNINIENRFSDDGALSWFEIYTDHAHETLDFFKNVFDYKVYVEHMGPVEYPMFCPPKVETRPVGAIVDVKAWNLPIEHKYVPFITYHNVDEILKNVTKFGGTVCKEKVSLPGVGDFGFITDNNGCMICVIRHDDKKLENMRAERNGAADGLIGFGEVLAENPKSTAEFYHNLFGYEVKEQTMQVGGHGELTFYNLKNKTATSTTLLVMPKAAFIQSKNNVFNLYFGTTDLDASIKRVEKAGGKVLQPRMPIGASAFVGVCTDPYGTVFGFAQDNEYLKEYIV